MIWRDPNDDPESPDDFEDPDESDVAEPDEPDLAACPECGKAVHAESGRCHHCGVYILRAAAPRRMSLWLIVGVALTLVAVLFITL